MAIEGNTGSTSLMTGTFNFLPCDDLVGIPLALHPVSFRESLFLSITATRAASNCVLSYADDRC